MDLSRRKFLGKSVVGGIALSTLATSALADNSFEPLPPLPTKKPAPAKPVAPPVQAAPPPVAPTPPPVVAPPLATPVSAEGEALTSAAIASLGYAPSDADSAEVHKWMDAYPASVNDLRQFKLSNGDAPNMDVTASLRPTANKAILGIKI
jgi:hypothetical protein